MAQEKKYDVFISYSTKDSMIAKDVCDYLENHRIRCFVAERDIPKTIQWADAIPAALRDSKMMLAIFSGFFQKSERTSREVCIAAKRKIPILTFRITDDDFEGVKEYFLTELNWIDAFPEPRKSFVELLNSIVLLINNQNQISDGGQLEDDSSVAVKERERIFISYKRVDKERVFAIKDGIEQATGEKCWIDLDGIESNAQFVAKIVGAIDECEIFLFMRSKEHNNITNLETDWTIREVNYALEEHKNIVIVNLDKTPMPKWFKFMFPNKQEIDATDPEKIDRLYKDLCGWLGIAYNEFSNQLKVETDEPVSLGSVHELVALGAKLGSDGVPEKLQEQFVNDLVKTKRLATAQNNLGFHLSDTEKRIKYLEEAAQNGSGAALINLAQIYESGKGVERDIDKAIDYYRTAIVHHGHTEFVDDIRALIKEKESKAKEAKSQPIHPILPISVNGVSFNMIKVQGGTFTIGATPEQESENPWDDERPAHEVAVTDYMIGETPVTQALWEAVMGVSIQEQSKKGTLGSSLRGVGANYPMYHISWDDCQEFVARLSQKTGKKFRMPTEAEWEFAARGGNQGKGFKYAGSDTINDVAWHDDGQTFETSPVAQKQPNELGLYDMSGNVWEWCQDWYINYGVELTPAILKSAGMSHVTRGGSWNRAPRFCRVSVRGHSTPNERVNYVGLRVVMEIE